MPPNTSPDQRPSPPSRRTAACPAVPPERGACSSARVAGSFALLFAAPVALLLALVVAGWGPLLALDTAVADGLHKIAVTSPGWTWVNRLLTDWVWDPWAMRLGLAVVVCWLVRRGDRRLGYWVAGTAVVGAALQQAMKAVVDRDRPVWPDPVDSAHFEAFPSGHAMSVALAGGVALWLLRTYGVRGTWRRAAAALITVSVLGVGFTRVFLGVHWPSDVLGGWLLGGALVSGAMAAYTAYGRPPGRAGAGGGATEGRERE